MIIRNLKTKLLAAGCLGTALGIGGWAFAQGPLGTHGGPGRGLGGFGFHRVLRQLDLTEEQEVMAVRLTRNIREQREQRKEAHKARLREVTTMVASGTVDQERMHALVDELSAERTAVAHRAVDAFLELEKTFTPEQRTQLQEIMTRWMERRDR